MPVVQFVQYPAEIGEEVKKRSRGEFSFRQSGNLVATAWKDNMVSTPEDHTTVDRTQKDGSKLAVHCPVCVALYNRCVCLKCRKNYKYVFWFLFDVAIMNAYVHLM